jgi:hypothetical protein
MPAEDLAWLGSFAAALLVSVSFALIAPWLAKHYPSAQPDIFRAWRGYSIPEQTEDVRAILALAAPFVVAAVVLVFGTRGAPRRSLEPTVVAIQAIGLILVVWAALNQRHVLPLLPQDYIAPLLVSVPVAIAGVLIGLALTALMVAWDRPAPRWASRIDVQKGRAIPLLLAVAATAVFILPAVVTDGTIARAGLFAPNQIATHAEDYFAVVNGRTPLVDYVGQYANLLPFALAPLLSGFDSSITAFSIAMCLLGSLALLAVFGVFKEVTRSPWAALALYVPFIALSLIPWHDSVAVREFNGNYYALLPNRLLGPFLLAWLCARWARGHRIPVWAIFFGVGLTELNNSEFGIGAFVAVAVALVAGGSHDVPLRRRFGELARQAVIGLLAAVVIVSAVTLIRAGDLPKPVFLTYYSRLFLRESIALAPMQSLGVHWALFATHAGALLSAAIRYRRGDADRALTAMLAFAGAFGLVTGMYFVGRSVELQLMILFPIWALSLALLAWTAAGALRRARHDRARLGRVLIPAAATLVGFGVMVAAIGRASPPWRQVDRLTDGGPHVYNTSNAQRYVASHTEPGERILLLGTPIDHRVAERAGVVNVSPFNGYQSLFTRTEANRALDQLQEEGGTEVIESVTAPRLSPIAALQVAEFADMLSVRGYRLVERDPSTGLRLWRLSTAAPAT